MGILTERYEDAGDFFGLRQEYRKRNLARVRRDHGLPTPEMLNGRMVYRDQEGKPRPWAVSRQKAPGREEMDQFWGAEPEFKMLEVADDGVPLEAELSDLARDAHGLERSEGVDFGESAVPCPQLRIINIQDDDAVDRELQEYIKNHGQL